MESELTAKYERALNTLVDKLKQDPYVLGAILCGSLSHDVVWEKSDIDLLVITQEVKHRAEGYTLIEDGVIIHAFLKTRSAFRHMLEGSLRSSFMHSLLVKGRLLFTRDDTLTELFEQRHYFGARDREIQLLLHGATVLPTLLKAEKWLYVKKDCNYCLVWLLATVTSLAKIEAVFHSEITGREVIHQALRLNPTFFEFIYTDLLQGDPTPERLTEALQAIHRYLTEKIPILYKPLLNYLQEAGTVRSTTEIDHYFAKQMGIEFIDMACEWLADENVIQKVSTPLRLTEKSRVDVQEAAYYYDGEQHE